MRKYRSYEKTFSTLIVFYRSSGTAQSDFAPIGAKWYYNYSQSSVPPYADEYELYEVTGVRTLDGRQMKAITGKRWDYWTNQMIPTDTFYAAGTADTVFYYHKQLQRNVPLYVFNVQAGDTLQFYKARYTAPPPQDSFWRCIVDSVTLETVNGRSLRRIHTNPYYTPGFTWDEGYMEMAGGLFYYIPWTSTRIPEDARGLRCYIDSQLSFHYFAFSLVSTCDEHGVPASVSPQPMPPEWRISPNPASGELHLNGIPGQSSSYVLYSIDGRALLSGTATAPANLSVSMIPAGTYLLHLKINGNLFVQKVVVSP